MKKTGTLTIAAALVIAFVGLGAFPPTARAGEGLFRFDQLAGVPRPFTGGDNAIRGVRGGGLPWVIARGEARLDDDGELRVEVEGLVIDPDDQAAIDAGRAGGNPVGSFKAILSCLSVDGMGNKVTVNVETGLFPATTGLGAGDSEIRAILTLPDPCIAPILFVTSPGGSWFAASGFEGFREDGYRHRSR